MINRDQQSDQWCTLDSITEGVQQGPKNQDARPKGPKVGTGFWEVGSQPPLQKLGVWRGAVSSLMGFWEALATQGFSYILSTLDGVCYCILHCQLGSSDRVSSFRYATEPSGYNSPLYAYLNPSFSSPFSPSITPSLFHSKPENLPFW